MVNSADPDQLASSEANWSGSTLFAKQDISRFSRTRVKNNKHHFQGKNFFFFFFFIWVLRPFQEYFIYIKLMVHQRWAKTREHVENHLTIRKQNLAFPHVTWVRLEPQQWET